MTRSKRSAEKEEFWRLLLAEQEGCGLSIRTFCQQKAISEPSFYAWRKELQKRDAERTAGADRGVRLIPVEVVSAMRESATSGGCGPSAQVEIGTPGGFTLRFNHDASPETISRLLEMLAQFPSGGAASC